MNYIWQRRYTGPIQAVIFDWAGTTVDFGCMAPIAAFRQLFARQQVPITQAEARIPMGTEKREHIRQIAHMPRVAGLWQSVHGRPVDDDDIDRLYEALVPLQIEAIAQYADPVPHLTTVMGALRERGYLIGANTGYSSEMMAGLLDAAADCGYRPDSNVCATEVPRGRPAPDMCLRNMVELGINNVSACVKVDDTPVGIEEGLNAGLWTVGVAISGNEAGLSLAEWQSLSAAEQQAVRLRASAGLQRAGAHYVIDTIADLVSCLDDIELRLSRGETP
ncbi:phosphonoacetaldehyde hydrolase [Kistimonas asteriae]|uniref:phosphonoacetaldehyde hydrolase n=1 Tax=Kistimonas asteriae TaxID=517724 RepID=UPI001BA5D5CE|nr:phosphonoacetaldehyde hydrolase [Kistimonas asteriae]